MNRSETGNTKEALLIRSLANTLVSPCGDACCLVMHSAFLLVTDLGFHWGKSLSPHSQMCELHSWSQSLSQSGLRDHSWKGSYSRPKPTVAWHSWTLKVNRDLTQSSESEPRGVCWDLQDRLSFFAAGRDPGELMAAIMEIVGHLLRRELT